MKHEDDAASGPRWSLFAYTEVPDHDTPALLLFKRWRIFECPWFGLYVHHLIRSDSPTRGLHDHPWPFVSITLRGQYTEYLPVQHGFEWKIEHDPTHRRVHVHSATDLHNVQVDNEAGAWTLILRGPRNRTWGFWRPGRGWHSNRDDTGPTARHAGFTQKV